MNARKRDSQDICFVPDGYYAKFIEGYLGKTYPDGDFVVINGNVIGRHHGIIRYTNKLLLPALSYYNAHGLYT